MPWKACWGEFFIATILSWASAHGCSQLKCQKLRVGSYTEKVLKCPCARTHPGCEVSCPRGYCIVASSVLRRGQPDSGESCIVLQSKLTRSLVAKCPQCSVFACSTRTSYCRGRTLRMRPQMGVCELLMPDVMAPKVHQDNCAQWTYLWIHCARI